jgi:hypothetical protein
MSNFNTIILVMVSTIILGIVSLNFSCSKSKTLESICSVQPPSDEMCKAAFQRWFYNKSKNQCELKYYSGCSAKGFETQEACENKCK